MSYDISVERHLRATPTAAFRHWVDPDARRVWYRGDEDDWVVHAETDLRVGGRFLVRWGPSLEDAYQEEGVFEVVDAPHRLVYTSRFTPRSPSEGDAFVLRVQVTFSDTGGGTLLRLSESGFPTAEVRDAFRRDGASQGLDYFERSLTTAI